MAKRKRIELTKAELSAVIGAAGDVDYAHFECVSDDKRIQEKVEAAFERGMDKLRELLARKEGEVTNAD